MSAPQQTHPPLFVGGCPRSGTTMLRSMLNSHPDLAVPHETLFLVDAYRMRRRWGDLRVEANRERLAEWVIARRETRVGRLARSRKKLARRMVAAPGSLGSVLAAPFEVYAERHGKRRWGDKRPSYVLNLDAIAAMYPDAQYVNVVRDPRAAVASIKRIGDERRGKGWYRDGLSAGVDLWDLSQKAADRARRRLGAGRFHEVVYERLVEDPETVLGELCAFLDLDPAGIPQMLAFHEQADINAQVMHPLVTRPVTAEAVRKWERQLEREEIALIEDVCGTRMRRYGYEFVAADVAVPREMRKRLRRRQLYQRRKLANRWAFERWRNLTYRHPVAAVRR